MDGTVDSAQWVALSGRHLPDGAWGCFNTGTGVGLLEDFTGADVATCKSNGYLRDGRVLIETVAQPTVIEPTDSAAFEHSYECIHQPPIPVA